MNEPMKFIIRLTFVVTSISVSICFSSCKPDEESQTRKEVMLWYNEPASEWNEALPVGNGRLGAMIFGDPNLERIQLNEESVWCRKGRYADSDGKESMPRVRALLFNGKYAEAQDLAVDKLLQKRLPSGTNAYQTLGEIVIRYDDTSRVTGYRRSLNLEEAVARVDYERNGTEIHREVFVSAVDDMLVFREVAEQGPVNNCHIQLIRPGEGEEVTLEGNIITMKQHVEGGQGVKYETRLKVITQGGKIVAEGNGLRVHNATGLELRLWAATDYSGSDPSSYCQSIQEENPGRSYEAILADHVKEYQEYFNRVSIDLGVSSTRHLPTDKRLELVAETDEDPGLAALYFNYGRYLLISSSRPGNLPANLQGIWNDKLIPPWNADYHITINLQMNYWPAEVTNLSECHLPYLRFLGELRESGRKTAQTTYNCRGFVAHHTTDVWHQTQLFGSPSWGMWPMGAAWSATHIWEHYLFTGDLDFLEEYGYEVMREAALFMSDFLVEHPVTGKLVTGPSLSPENRFATPQGDTAAINMGPAMDLQIVWHLFTSCIAAAEVLDTDHQFSAKLKSQLDRLSPVKIGSDGRILEWSEEGLTEVSPGHRHMSHLYGLYPSPQYNWADTPEYMAAAEKVIDNRLQHGGGHTGWSRAWMINFYARLKEGEQAQNHIQKLLEKSTLPNLFDNHPPFQIDGNFGGTAGIAECLIQSHAGYVELLPALPSAWKEGRVTGLVARGGFQVDMEWEGGELTKVKVLSRLGNPLTLKLGDSELSVETFEGESLALDGMLRFL